MGSATFTIVSASLIEPEVQGKLNFSQEENSALNTLLLTGNI